MLRLLLVLALSATSLAAGPTLLPRSLAIAQQAPPPSPAPTPQPQTPRPTRDCHEPPVTS
jgi:hypothetical protein